MLTNETTNGSGSQPESVKKLWDERMITPDGPDYCQFHKGQNGPDYYTTVAGYDPEPADLEFVIATIDEKLAGIARIARGEIEKYPVDDQILITLKTILDNSRAVAVRQLKETEQ